jgi:conjugal transfer pilus assembly protein TraW
MSARDGQGAAMSSEMLAARRARLVVIIQAATIGLLIIAALAVSLAAKAQGLIASRSAIGRTWPIAEPDALAEIEAKVTALPRDMSNAFGPRSSWSALKAAELAVAPADKVRTVVPFYTLDFDIRLPDGKTLYPKGYSFNPLTYVRLPQRLVVVHPRDLAWGLKTAHPGDFILLTALNGENGDPITLTERTGRSIYILEDRVKDRLGLTVAPVIVAQAGAKLILTEFGPQIRKPAQARK